MSDFGKYDPSPFRDFRAAADAVASAFIGENIAGPLEDMWRKEWTPKIREALEADGQLPNWYEVEALNGGVPEDGSWPETDETEDYGCPEEVRKKFPRTDKIIADQF